MLKLFSFLKKSWVPVVAAGAIILSAVLLATSIRVARSVDQTYLEPNAWDAMPAVATPPPQSAQANSDYTAPEYFMAFDTSAGLPSAKDISVKEAADTAALLLTQLFDAQLDGEICHAYFETSDMRVDNTGRWQIQFGSNTFGATRYVVGMDSLSGKPTSATKYIFNENVEAAIKMAQEANATDAAPAEIQLPNEKDVVSPADYPAFREAAIIKSRQLAQQYFSDAGSVNEVLCSNMDYDIAGAKVWEDTGLGYAPDISVKVLLSDGSGIVFVFGTREGFLKEVYFSGPQAVSEYGVDTGELSRITNPAVEVPQAVEAMPVSPTDGEFDYGMHWENVEEDPAALTP